MLIKVYVTALVMFTAFAVTQYRKYRNVIGKRNYSSNVIKLFAGVALVLLKRRERRGAGSKLREKISKLESSESVEEKQRTYREEKIAVVCAIVMGTLILAIIGEILNDTAKNISSITRNAIGEGEKLYSIEAMFDDGKSETLEISVGEEKPDETEANRLFDEKQDGIINKMLAGNDKARVDSNLDFGQVSCGDINIIWDVEDTDIISYDGKIKDGIPKQGKETQVYAYLSLGKFSRNITVDIVVFPKNGMKDVKGYIQEYVDESAGEKGSVELPKSIDGNRVYYRELKDGEYRYIFPFGCLIACIYFFLGDRNLDGLLKKRKEQLEADYPEIVCKLLLLSLAGLSVRKTFKKIYCEASKNKKDRYVYREIKLMLMKMERGLGEAEAYEEFGRRCELHSYVRLMNIIVGNLKRGSSELGNALEAELHSAFFERRNSALKMGETLGTKLLAPMVMLLIVSMAIIAAPAFMSFATSGDM